MEKYKFIIIPFISLIASQIIKFIIESIKHRKLCFRRLFSGSGGMPSTHSSFVSSLATSVYLELGATSIIFATTLVFSLVIIYDSMGVRYEAGKQAEVLNDIVEKMNFPKNIKELKEKVGHKPIEVLCGVIVGMTTGLLLY